MNNHRQPRGGRIATRNGRPAYLAPIVRESQPVTNAEWFAMRRQHTKADFLEAIFGRLLEKVRP